jgi:hypothetical protein
MKKFCIILIVLLIYTLIIFAPPIIHGYVYPNTGDDTGFHLNYFNKIQDGVSGSLQYWGQNIIGCPLVWVGNLTGTSLSFLFMWFNFIVLWMIGIVYFIVLAKLINYKVGLLAIPMVMFIIPSTLNLYDNGSIYDLMTVGIIFPILIFCNVKLWATKKWYWSIPLVVVVGLFMVVHTMGIIGGSSAYPTIPSFSQFLSIYTGYILPVLLVFALFYLICLNKWNISKEHKITLISLTVVIVALSFLVFTNLIGWSMRLASDLAIILPLLVVSLLGIFIYHNKVLFSIIATMIVVLSIPLCSSYFQYNSAVKPLDKEVIEYVNTLDGEYFSCSPEVAPWIYGQFLNKKYKEGELPYIIRSQPMSPRTNADAKDFWRGKNGALGYPRPYEWLRNYSIKDAIVFVNDDLKILVITKGEK